MLKIKLMGSINKMPFCGFNQEMLEGLEKFHTGLVERLIRNSETVIIKEETRSVD